MLKFETGWINILFDYRSTFKGFLGTWSMVVSLPDSRGPLTGVTKTTVISHTPLFLEVRCLLTALSRFFGGVEANDEAHNNQCRRQRHQPQPLDS